MGDVGIGGDSLYKLEWLLKWEKLILDKMRRYLRELKHCKQRLKRPVSASFPNDGEWLARVERARSVSIHELLPDQPDRTGKYFCPFHDDRKTPNFQVFDDGGWKCFACGAGGGDAIAFVMKRDNCGFVEAVKRLTGG